ncbi:MAG: 5-(carboxyamino)imidazole ribonucleotide synthase, partial [Anaerolineae bacterium]|nr:5-(carboxyamino)imidazole ribonucleotide synthase [Anaerolineae bacterium]
GIAIYPHAATLATIQDKLMQKQRFAAADLAVPAFRGVNDPADVIAAAQDFGYPLVLKARYGGYDGYGNATLHHADDLPTAWAKLADRPPGVMVEQFVPFIAELAVIVLRSRDGEIRTYPVVETVQQNHICHVVRAPATLSPETLQSALTLARQAVELLDGVGVFGVELFLLADGRVLLNEIAPRPHNSGHYTIEACITSQFENHLRAVLGLPLGSTELRAPAAVMVNLLGARNGPIDPWGIRAALATPGVHLHLYGKREVRVGRKMGHITVLGESVDAAEAIARKAATEITL